MNDLQICVFILARWWPALFKDLWPFYCSCRILFYLITFVSLTILSEKKCIELQQSKFVSGRNYTDSDNWLIFPSFFRSALQTLHKSSSKALDHHYFEGGINHDWVDFYHRGVTSDQSCINEWNAMDSLESKRPPSPDSLTDK